MVRKSKAVNHLVNRKSKIRLVDEIAASSTAAVAIKPSSQQHVQDSGPREPFRFFDLPSELRLRIYEILLLFPTTIDLDPSNHHLVAPSLRLFLVNQRMHNEASRVFYSLNTFRVFPIHGRYINRKHPLLAWLPRRYRTHMTRLELRLGPGFTRPPKSWVVDNRLGLAAATNLRTLRVFIELDPAANDVFEGFRVAPEFYTEYCVALLRALLVVPGPAIVEVEFDGFPSVERDGPLLSGLVREARAQQRRVLWGVERGWGASPCTEGDLIRLIKAASLGAA